ncbi:MAG: MBL fold metallo-hydrolase [Dehalococcoidales bacterium]|nr:MBL fold metallo-hydrolase [Dehalococcoidales bacterium]
MVDVQEVAANIYMIDNQLYSIPKFGSTYLLNEDNKALVDSGPTTSVNVVLEGIRKLGLKPEDINHIIITHVHLDHAGGAGVLLQYMPQATIWVHSKGARHLINPKKLMSSLVETQGEEALVKNGKVMPIKKDRIQIANDNTTIKLGNNQVLRFIDAPGHAPHQVCIYENRNGGIFTGDAVGNYIDQNEILIPITPPPSFNAEQYINTLYNLMKLNANIIYFAHFSTSNKVQENLKLAINKIKNRHNIITEAVAMNNPDNGAKNITARETAEMEPVREGMSSLYQYWTNVSIPMSAAGHVKYYQDRAKLN